MECSNCNDKDSVGSRYYFDTASAKDERIIKTLIVVVCVLGVLLAGCVAVCVIDHRNSTSKIESINNKWIDYISQYDFEDYTVDLTTDGGGDASYVGGNGAIYNGTSGGTETDSETQGRQVEGQSDTP